MKLNVNETLELLSNDKTTKNKLLNIIFILLDFIKIIDEDWRQTKELSKTTIKNLPKEDIKNLLMKGKDAKGTDIIVRNKHRHHFILYDVLKSLTPEPLSNGVIYSFSDIRQLIRDDIPDYKKGLANNLELLELLNTKDVLNMEMLDFYREETYVPEDRDLYELVNGKFYKVSKRRIKNYIYKMKVKNRYINDDDIIKHFNCLK